jgi:protein-disulfide isomerase
VKCLSDQSTIDRVNAQIAEWQSFGINGTPGNVIIDKQTGKYVIVAGAYPFEEFDTKVSAMLK